MSRKPYPSDLTDGQWQVLALLLPLAKPGGRPRTLNRREVLNGSLYMLRNGCPWRRCPTTSHPGTPSGGIFRTW